MTRVLDPYKKLSSFWLPTKNSKDVFGHDTEYLALSSHSFARSSPQMCECVNVCNAMVNADTNPGPSAKTAGPNLCRH